MLIFKHCTEDCIKRGLHVSSGKYTRRRQRDIVLLINNVMNTWKSIKATSVIYSVHYAYFWKPNKGR